MGFLFLQQRTSVLGPMVRFMVRGTELWFMVVTFLTLMMECKLAVSLSVLKEFLSLEQLEK